MGLFGGFFFFGSWGSWGCCWGCSWVMLGYVGVSFFVLGGVVGIVGVGFFFFFVGGVEVFFWG